MLKIKCLAIICAMILLLQIEKVRARCECYDASQAPAANGEISYTFRCYDPTQSSTLLLIEHQILPHAKAASDRVQRLRKQYGGGKDIPRCILAPNGSVIPSSRLESRLHHGR